MRKLKNRKRLHLFAVLRIFCLALNRYKKIKKFNSSSKKVKSVPKRKILKIYSPYSPWMQKTFIVLFFFLGALLYAATIKGDPGNPSIEDIRRSGEATNQFEQSAERARFAHTYALVENKSLSLTKELADAVRADIGYANGRYYSFFAPGTAMIAVPFYIIGKHFSLAQVTTFSIVSLFALGSMIFLYKIGKDIFKLSNANALLSPIIFAFASTSWSYATTLYQHHLTAFFIISSFYAVWRYNKKTKLSFLWGAYVWAAYGLAFTIDYPNLVLMLPIMAYFFFSSVSVTKIKNQLQLSLRPAIILTSLAFIIISSLHAYYNQTQLGSWKRLNGNITGYKVIQEQQLFSDADGRKKIEKIQNSKKSTSFFREENLPIGAYLLTIAPEKGLFFFSPIFLLAIAGILSLIGQLNKRLVVLLGVVGINFFLYSSFGDPWGGWAFGPRYLIVSMSVLSLFIALWLSSVKHQFLAKLLTFILFAYSSAISLLGVLTTNAVPPKVEADYLKMKYGYFLNLEYFLDGRSSSFIYNQYISNILSLQEYFVVLYTVVLIMFLAILLMVRRQEAYET